MLAATVVVPTLMPGDLIVGLGVGSVAIGFAFKDILQNMLAGVLILLRQP
jgi:small conductance mechanosensitive channel